LKKREKKKKREENRLGPSYVDHLGFEFINSKSISSRDQHKNPRYTKVTLEMLWKAPFLSRVLQSPSSHLSLDLRSD